MKFSSAWRCLGALVLVLCLWRPLAAAQDVPLRNNSTTQTFNSTTPIGQVGSSNVTLATFVNSTTQPEPLPEEKGNQSVSIAPVLSAHTCGVKDGKSVRKLRVVTSSTDEYFPVFMNWLVYYHKICPTIANIYFICLDTVIEKKLPQYGLSCSHVYHSSGVHDIWLVRSRLTHSLLKEGYDVLLTDSDALWVHNPFPYIEKYITSDVVSSRGSFPDYVSKPLGATLCMGFIYIKASEHTVTLWGEIAARMGRTPNPDDQKEINSYFLTLKLHYKVKPTYIGSTDFNTGHFNHHNHNYAITLLPHTLFRRICDAEKIGDVKSSVVAHCLTHQKVGAHKQSTAESMGVWLLKDDWNTIALHSDMDAYLNSISIDNEGANHRVVRVMLASEGMQRGVRVYSSEQNLNNSLASTLGSTHYIRGSQVTHNTALCDPLHSINCGGSSSSVCYEYHANRAQFNVSDQSCWYVSSSAPEASVREFERLASTQKQ